MRAEVLGVQNAKAFRRFQIFAHGISDSRTGVDAGEGRPDQCEKHGRRLARHEDASPSRTEYGIADYNHHVPDGGGRSRRVLHRVATVQKVVGGKVFEQVTESTLQDQGVCSLNGEFGCEIFTA